MPANQNLSIYTKTDPAGHYVVTADRSTFTNASRSVVEYVGNNFGVGYFADDFYAAYTLYLSAYSTALYFYTALFARVQGSIDQIRAVDRKTQGLSVNYVSATTYRVALVEDVGAGLIYTAQVPYDCDINTPYYPVLYRLDDLGAYGTLICELYSHPSRTAPFLLGTASLALHSKEDFNWFYVGNDVGNVAASTVSGYSEFYEIYNAIPEPGGVTILGFERGVDVGILCGVQRGVQ